MSDWCGDHSNPQALQSIVNLQFPGTSDHLTQGIGTIRVLPSQTEWSRCRHDVTEGIMTSADDMRPEATLLIGLIHYALQRQSW